MTITEINSQGNFEAWDEARINEIKDKKFSSEIGKLLFENAELKLWQIDLKPFERLPFRIHTNNYSCISFSEGLALTRNVNGQINLLRLQKGHHFYRKYSGNETIFDFENVGENDIKVTVLEEKMKMEPETAK